VSEASANVRARTRSVLWPSLVPGLAAVLVLVLGQPFLVNDARTPGWREVPQAWQEAYDFLEQQQDGSTTLVVPGSGFALQGWGWTYDEPMHALGDDVRWATRSQVPIIPGQSIRVLSAIDRLVSQGEADGSLGTQLARAGIGHVLVRRDLSRGFTDSPPPAGAAQSMTSAGLEMVAAFGEFADGGRAVEIYEVTDRLPRVRSTVRDQVATVAGAPEAWLPLVATGLVEPEDGTVSLGEPGWSGDASVVTDTNQRRERAFGRVEEPLSTVLQADEPYRLARSVPDYPVTPGSEQVVARYEDGVSVRASSSQGYADAYGSVVPQAGPQAAFDGDVDTRWVSSLAGKAREQWLRVEFPDPRAVHEVSVLPVMDDRAMAPVRRLQVRTSAESVSLETNPTGATVTAELSGEPVDWVEVRVVAASSVNERNQLAISEVGIDGHALRRVLVLPEPVDPGDALLLTGAAGTRACRATGSLPDCSTARIRAGEEPQGMQRQVEVSDDTEMQLEGLVVARASRATAQLLEPFLSEQQVGATSIYGDDPLVSSRFAYDDRADTQWMSSPDDPQPTLFFSWGVARRITGVRLPLGESVDPGYTRLVLRGAGRVERLTVTGELTRLPRPMRTKELEVSFVKDESGSVVSVPQIDLDGGGILRPFDPGLPTGTVCGLGPQVVVAGRTLQTRVDGTLGDLLSGAPMRLSTCTRRDPDGPVPSTRLAQGRAFISARRTAEFDVVAVAGRPAAGTRAVPRAVRVESEAATRLVADVAPGAEAVVSVPWNYNAGWEARLDGRAVDPIRVDGWQQGWIVPEGDGGELTMEFAPQGGYTLVLLAGLAVSGGLLLAGGVLLLLGRLRPSRSAWTWRQWPAAGTAPVAARAAVLAVVVALIGWVAGVAFVVGSLWSRGGLQRLAVVMVVMVLGSGALDAWPLPMPGSVADGLAVGACGLALALAMRGPVAAEDAR
jgi:arabinofuranan 3-O-arabinosyltransferase